MRLHAVSSNLPLSICVRCRDGPSHCSLYPVRHCRVTGGPIYESHYRGVWWQNVAVMLLQVYDTLDYYARPQQQVPTAAATPAAEATTAANSPHSALQPPDLLRCISTLAALKYSQPARLAALLDLRSAGRPGLSCLRMQQLSGLVAALTRAGVKPSNAWLLALMQVCGSMGGHIAGQLL